MSRSPPVRIAPFSRILQVRDTEDLFQPRSLKAHQIGKFESINSHCKTEVITMGLLTAICITKLHTIVSRDDDGTNPCDKQYFLAAFMNIIQILFFFLLLHIITAFQHFKFSFLNLNPYEK